MKRNDAKAIHGKARRQEHEGGKVRSEEGGKEGYPVPGFCPPPVRTLWPSWAGRGRGVALVWTAVVLFVLTLLVGLSIDLGKAAFNLHELQNAADAAALAGAQWVKVNQTTARDRAQQLAGANDTEKIPVWIARNDANVDTVDVKNLASGDVNDLVLGRWDKLSRTFTATLINPNAVKVVARRITDWPDGAVALIFGHLAGVDTANITRESIAHSTGATGAGIICLDPGQDQGLKIHGNVTLDLQGGDIMVNSAASTGLVIDGAAAFVNCDLCKVVGGYKLTGGLTEATLPFDIMTGKEDGVTAVDDPLADLKPPPVYDAAHWPWPDLSLTNPKNHKVLPDTGPRTDASGNPVPFQPGYYSGGFDFTSATGRMDFNPGIYVVGGAGLQMNSGELHAEGVMFYIADGSVNFGGKGTVVMSPPSAAFTYPAAQQAMAQYYADVTLFQARDNTSNQATIIGTSTYNIGGVLYFPHNDLKLEGTAGNTFRPGDQLICWTADIGGNGVLQIQYDGQNVIAGFRSVLVR